MRLDVVTIFPAYLDPLRLSLIGKAREQGLLDVHVHDLRDFTTDRHRSVDDTPYGGGPGMVMRAEPWARALEHVVAAGPVSGASAPLLVVPTPAGTRFTQARARELSGEPWLAFACGRYEGLDERILLHARGRMRVLEVSLGDFVLNGGEVAVLAVVEAVVRLLPGVVGNAESLLQESHEDGLLDYPVYTRPPTWHGHDVPGALLSGHHKRIARWRRDERLRRTARARPDLVARLDQALLDDADRAVLADAVLADAVLADAVPSDAVQPPGAAVADWTVAPAAERPGPAPATGGVERGEPHRPRRS